MHYSSTKCGPCLNLGRKLNDSQIKGLASMENPENRRDNDFRYSSMVFFLFKGLIGGFSTSVITNLDTKKFFYERLKVYTPMFPIGNTI